MFNYISAVSVHENHEFFPTVQWNKKLQRRVIICIFESQASVSTAFAAVQYLGMTLCHSINSIFVVHHSKTFSRHQGQVYTGRFLVMESTYLLRDLLARNQPTRTGCESLPSLSLKLKHSKR